MDINKSFNPAKSLTEFQQYEIGETISLFLSLAEDLNELPESREKSLCMTKLQEAKFWAIECIAKNPIEPKP